MESSTDELTKFRSEWEKEVQARKRIARVVPSTASKGKSKATESSPAESSTAIKDIKEGFTAEICALEADDLDTEQEQNVEAGGVTDGYEEQLSENDLGSSTEELVQSITQMDLSLELELQAATNTSAVAVKKPAESLDVVVSETENTEGRLPRRDRDERQTDSPAAELPMDYADISENLLAAESGVGSELSRAQRALMVYELAVEKERVGNLSDALKFYRQAFRVRILFVC